MYLKLQDVQQSFGEMSSIFSVVMAFFLIIALILTPSSAWNGPWFLIASVCWSIKQLSFWIFTFASICRLRFCGENSIQLRWWAWLLMTICVILRLIMMTCLTARYNKFESYLYLTSEGNLTIVWYNSSTQMAFEFMGTIVIPSWLIFNIYEITRGKRKSLRNKAMFVCVFYFILFCISGILTEYFIWNCRSIIQIAIQQINNGYSNNNSSNDHDSNLENLTLAVTISGVTSCGISVLVTHAVLGNLGLNCSGIRSCSNGDTNSWPWGYNHLVFVIDRIDTITKTYTQTTMDMTECSTTGVDGSKKTNILSSANSMSNSNFNSGITVRTSEMQTCRGNRFPEISNSSVETRDFPLL